MRPEIRQTIEMCRHCFMCRHANPTFLVTKLDSHTPRGYALALSRVGDGLATWTEDLASKLYQSTLDGLCAELCEFDWREDLVVQAGRVEAVQTGMAPAAVLRAAARRRDGPIGLPTPLPVDPARIDRVNAEVLYVTGLEARERAPATIAATAALLGHLGLDWTILSAEGDPGIDLWELGFPDAAATAAQRFVDTVCALRPSRLVTGSSRVLRALREPLPSPVLAAAPEVEHLSELLDRRLGGALPHTEAGIARRVAYHDPCSLGRRAGVFDPPRRVIERLTGEPPLEFAHNREVAECCGEGGLLPEIDPTLAARLAAAQLARRPADVTTVVTGCPGCRALLGEAARAVDGKVEVLDLSELAAARLGLRW